ncbi:MAG: guanylate kinase [Burkholderiaceae bacterium]
MADTHPTSGSLFMVVAPSGAGKSTLVNALLAQEPTIKLSVSYTTRDPRPGEQNGREYHFTSVDEFLKKRDAGEFLEYAEVHGNFYGSPRKPIEAALAGGKDVLFDIDWQGAQQLYAKMRKDVVGVFVLPPSASELKSRLERRAEDSHDVIARRLRNARNEIRHWDEYDHVIVNKDFEKAFIQLKNILAEARARRGRQVDLAKRIKTLDADLAKLTLARKRQVSKKRPAR